MEEKSKEDSDIRVTDIFKQENFISEKRIAYIVALDEHLQTHYLDQQFGRIASANGLASEKAVANALEHQKIYFEKNRIHMTIGDILLGNGSITPSDQISILLTQNRIKDEELLDALNSLGETQTEKDSINKRFGVLAIKKNLLTIEQVNTALDIQKDERNSGKTPPFIGQILQETTQLSDTDIQQILQEQKQFEKRRVDLEKALYPVKAEIKISKTLNRFFEYHISQGGLEAVVKKQMEIDEPILIYEFHIWLRRVGIRFGVVEDADLETFIQNDKKNSQSVVAKGYPPVQSTNEKIEFYFEDESIPIQQKPDNPDPDNPDPDKPDPDNSKDQEEVTPPGSENEQEESDEVEVEVEDDDDDDDDVNVTHNPFLIKKDSLLARIIPGQKGKPGKDVLGYPIQPGKPAIAVLIAGNNVIQKGYDFFAQMEGRPVLKNGTTLMIEPVVKKPNIKIINHNITDDTKDTYESARVELKGTITKEAVLRCSSLLLHGHILGQVICTGEIDVNGNIGIDENPPENPTDIICQGSVKVSNAIVNSRIQTHQELLAVNSTLVGSEVIAFKGMAIKDSLSGKNAVSILRFGIKPGDKILSVDHTMEKKTGELECLKKEPEIRELTDKHTNDVEKEETRQSEQAILINLMEIIQAPELYQYDGLNNKILYLNRLPDFSSIKSCYLKFPETDAARAFLYQMLTATQGMSPENILIEFQKKIEPISEDENLASRVHLIETDFKGRLAALEQEIANQSEEIKQLENELKGLRALRQKLESIHLTSLIQSRSAIKIKNKCEKGTIIKGKIAQLVVKNTLYNVTFKEVLDRRTHQVSIKIET